MVEQRQSPREGDLPTGTHWKGHVFLFDRRRSSTYEAWRGRRLLLIFVLLEAVIGPRWSLPRWLNIATPPDWARIPLSLALALALVRFVAGLKLPEIGLVRWGKWTAIEKSYFVQIVAITNAIFLVVIADRLQSTVTSPAFPKRMATVFLPYLLWGFYQELVYRGILQTELVRRWGAVRGILASNILFTFGPLHFYHFSRSAGSLPMFAGIFFTGLFFATLFQRSGNLWIVGTLHGIGNAYIDGTARR